MTDVTFVRLDRREKAPQVCRWAEKFFNEGLRVLIRVEDDTQAQALDRYLWTWDKGAFVPHCCDDGSSNVSDEAVVITTAEHNSNEATALIMAHPCSVEFLRDFKVAVDFAEMYDPALTEESRRRFRLFRDSGMQPRMA